MNDHDNPKHNNPIIKNVFSLKLNSLIFLNRNKYVEVIVIKNNGIILDVTNIKIRLYLLELNKYWIPE